MDRESAGYPGVPYVFDIRRGSTNDGPGIRSVAFFKGCGLDCRWCHNPEGKVPLPQPAFFAGRCEGCGACAEVCPSTGGCAACGRCAEVCPSGARKIYGRKYTAEELAGILAADAPFYVAAGGGATFSGGECMLYPGYLADTARLLKERGVNVAADTAGYVPYPNFEAVLPYVDLFLYDIKCLDPVLHRRGTGADNALILENLEKLMRTGKDIVIRTPEIPGFNEGAELERVRAYCAARGLPHEVLPYHTFGEDKKAALEAARRPRR